MGTFDELLAEGNAVPTEGWDFSWFAGRATEERPPWGYSRLLAERMAATLERPGGGATLDLQTGGGEVVASTGVRPARLVVTECWPPNIEVARRNLAALGGIVVGMDDEYDDLPFDDASFDLVSSRHPVRMRWDEAARVLRPGGTYISQEVGFGSMHELSDFMLGTVLTGDGTEEPGRHPKWAVQDAEEAGLHVVDLREATLETVFLDVAAVVYYLRKVIWIVPGFTIEAYRDRLRAIHEQITTEGRYVAYSTRFLIEATKP
jgi:SAM-dependent methyltransferase